MQFVYFLFHQYGNSLFPPGFRVANHRLSRGGFLTWGPAGDFVAALKSANKEKEQHDFWVVFMGVGLWWLPSLSVKPRVGAVQEKVVYHLLLFRCEVFANWIKEGRKENRFRLIDFFGKYSTRISILGTGEVVFIDTMFLSHFIFF